MSLCDPCEPPAVSATLDETLLDSMNYRNAGSNCAECSFATLVEGQEYVCKLNPAHWLDVLGSKVCDFWEERV